jgi:two-component system sensor histidine kinase SenX3
VDALVAGTIGGAIGLVVGAVAVVASRWSERSTDHPVAQQEPTVPRGVGDMLSILRSIGIVVDGSDSVVNTSASAVSYGLVRRGELVHRELRHLVRQVRRDGMIREAELQLSRAPGGRRPLADREGDDGPDGREHAPSLTVPPGGDGEVVMQVRVAPLGADYVILLAEDHTHARRLEEVRRDFVANVSHELKTPVGGISLLAEAVLGATDDPEAVARFAHRIQVEATRLGRLVQEIVDLSRLQVADTLHEPELVEMATVASEAVDRVRVAAESRGISIDTAVDPGLFVFGDRELLITAATNLLSNAVSYSDEGTRVGVGGRRVRDTVELTVTDQGSGIALADQERIFERFYRVDAARSRATGGTGLGLAIVKHICANHGGEVTVWSEVGRGSTFTMRLPAAAETPEQGEGTAAPDGATAVVDREESTA